MKRLIFYFDPVSPFAFLAFERLPEALEGCSYHVDYRPVLLSGLLEAWGPNKSTGRSRDLLACGEDATGVRRRETVRRDCFSSGSLPSGGLSRTQGLTRSGRSGGAHQSC